MLLDVGIHANIPEAVYHGDPCFHPSASASILQTLYTTSPDHAWNDHPRLNPIPVERDSTVPMQEGTILHSIVLGTPAPYRALPFDDYRSTAAKAAKASAIEAGLIPIKDERLNELMTAARVLREKIERDYPDMWQAINDPRTLKEATVVWVEQGVLCRCRFDILPPPSYGFVGDLKFTKRTTEPDEWSRKLRKDYMFQPELYPRALKATRGDTPEFRLIAVETDAPYGLSMHAPAGDLQMIARRRVNIALRRWAHCLKTNEWPGYPPYVNYCEAPGWFLSQEEHLADRDNAEMDALGIAQDMAA